ncbi:MAG: hypothetical protein ACK4N4_10490 [Burkholderiales bacterium]
MSGPRIVVGLLFMFSACIGFAAEPLSLLLLRVLRDHLVATSAQAAFESARRDDRRPSVMPSAPNVLEGGKLRTLIDEGFVHLNAAQREEVYAGVKLKLADPRNAYLGPTIIEELALQASAVRQAHERLASLSEREKKDIAARMREEYAGLPAEDRQQMMAALQSGVAPIPRDLRDMILAEFHGAALFRKPR